MLTNESKTESIAAEEIIDIWATGCEDATPSSLLRILGGVMG
jgi:hypothetical protein